MTLRYHEGEHNRCPGCGGVHWHVGRATAECARCSYALPLADSRSKPEARILTFGNGGGVVRRMVMA
jgi:ribosomal protein L37E